MRMIMKIMTKNQIFDYLNKLQPYELSCIYHTLGLDYGEYNMKKEQAMNRNFFEAGKGDLDIFNKFVDAKLCFCSSSSFSNNPVYHVCDNYKDYIYSYWRNNKH